MLWLTFLLKTITTRQLPVIQSWTALLKTLEGCVLQRLASHSTSQQSHASPVFSRSVLLLCCFPATFNNRLTVESSAEGKHTHIPFLRPVHMVEELEHSLLGTSVQKGSWSVADVTHTVLTINNFIGHKTQQFAMSCSMTAKLTVQNMKHLMLRWSFYIYIINVSYTGLSQHKVKLKINNTKYSTISHVDHRVTVFCNRSISFASLNKILSCNSYFF